MFTALVKLGQSKPNFIWSMLGKGEINGQGHMTKMAAMAINRNQNQSQKANDFETWCEATGNGALQNLYKS